MGLLKRLVVLTLLCGGAYAGMTVNLGSNTLFGHFNKIWSTSEADALREDLRSASEPVVDTAKRVVGAGLAEARRTDGDAGTDDATAPTSPDPAPEP